LINAYLLSTVAHVQVEAPRFHHPDKHSREQEDEYDAVAHDTGPGRPARQFRAAAEYL
jgi:hypothetical protein